MAKVLDFHPSKCWPDCMMPDGGHCCKGYAKLYDAYWDLHKNVPDEPTDEMRKAAAYYLGASIDIGPTWRAMIATLKGGE